MMQFPKYIMRSKSGFTLIEVLVSMSIFTIVVGMAVGATIVLIDANARAQNVQQAVSNVAFALDSMSREIRTGNFYYATNGNPPSSGLRTRDGDKQRAFSFLESGDSLTGGCATRIEDRRISYRFNRPQNTIERRLCNGSWESIIAPNVSIDTFFFTVRNTDRMADGDLHSPLVTMYVAASVENVVGDPTQFVLQSSVTQHTLDI